MVVRYLKSLFTIMINGGLIGPFALVMYFTVLGPDERKYIWFMFYAGLVITVGSVLVALPVAWRDAKWEAAWKAEEAESDAKTAALKQNGVLALAQITGMSETGATINDHPLVKLDLHIAGPGFAFDTQERVIATVTTSGNFSKRQLVVLVDPATHHLEIDWQGSALVNGLVRAQFTLSDEGKTYDLSGQAEPLMEILQILKANGMSASGPLDLRANPAARQQVNEVVRRAAAALQPSAIQRLEQLNALRAAEAITEDEYAEKRRLIIAEI